MKVLFWTLMYALSPSGDEVILLGLHPSAMECGDKLLDYDTSKDWSVHCEQTGYMSQSPRPVMRSTSP